MSLKNPTNDPYLASAHRTYGGFHQLLKWGVISTIAILVGMALFLL